MDDYIKINWTLIILRAFANSLEFTAFQYKIKHLQSTYRVTNRGVLGPAMCSKRNINPCWFTEILAFARKQYDV